MSARREAPAGPAGCRGSRRRAARRPRRRCRPRDAPRAGPASASGSRPVRTSSARPCGSKRRPGAVPGREDHGHPVRPEPAGAEEQGARRGGVQPVRVVDDAQHQVLLGRGGQQRQGRDPHQERLDRGPVLLAERHPQGPRLRSGRPSRSRVTGRSSRCSAANASGASTSSPWVRSTRGVAGTAHELVEQGRLADAGLAADHQRAGRPVVAPARRALPGAARSGSRPTSTRRTYTAPDRTRAAGSNPAL